MTFLKIAYFDLTKGLLPILSLLAIMLLSCKDNHSFNEADCTRDIENYHSYALLSSRINDMTDLEKLVQLEYLRSGSWAKKDQVNLSFCSEMGMIYSELGEGVSQEEIMKAQKGSFTKKLEVLFAEPVLVQNRKHLKDIYLLSRRRHDVYGYGDVAFYDLALEASKKVREDEYAFRFERDSGEKGYINTFNHITAQAMITSIYSSNLADLVADVHERYNMPELIRGDFTKAQLESENNNPVDNYVDMINNEVGQIIGEQLKAKFGITMHQKWTRKLLCDYLNDLQIFYSKAFRIRMKPFREDEQLIIRFCDKLNSYYKMKHQAQTS